MTAAGAFPLDKRNLRHEKQPPCLHVFKIILLPLHPQIDSSMTKALKTYIPILVLLLAGCLASCDSAETKQRMAVADSLAEASPRAAIALADSLAPDVASRGNRMRLALIKAKAQNKLGMRLQKDTIAMLARYYDSHGSANERMLADYITGCYYKRKGEAPMALQYFQSAISKADTADKQRCDYKTLSRVYGQMGDLFQKQLSFENALDAGRLSMKYAFMAKDTLNAISEYGHLSDIYYFMGDVDSVMQISQTASELYLKHGDTASATSIYGVPLFIMLERGEVGKARRLMDFYDTYSGLYDLKTRQTKAGHEIYYYVKGMYHVHTNRLDSAEYFFRKELCTTNDFNNRQAAAKGLYLVYKERGVTDSIVKYAEMWNAAIDSSYLEMSTVQLQQMKAVYDYTESEKKAAEQTKKATRYKYLSVSLIMAFALAVFAILFILQKRKKDKALQERLNMNNTMNLLLLDKLEKELQDAKNAKVIDEKLIMRKTEEVERLQLKLSALDNDVQDKNENIFDITTADLPITDRLHALAGTSRKASQNDKESLVSFANDTMRGFMDVLNVDENKLNETELLVCIMIKLRFITSEMTCLLGISSQNQANIRCRLNKKIFKKDGGAKEFDYRIKNLLPTG